MTASWQSRRSIFAWPVTMASPSCVSISAFASRSLYGRRSKNSSGSAERMSASSSAKVPESASWAIRSRARTLKWLPQCAQTQSVCSSSSSR